MDGRFIRWPEAFPILPPNRSVSYPYDTQMTTVELHATKQFGRSCKSMVRSASDYHDCLYNHSYPLYVFILRDFVKDINLLTNDNQMFLDLALARSVTPSRFVEKIVSMSRHFLWANHSAHYQRM
ncbi:hypothetical protein EG68_00398 [Paragonimus skrjabini miyazakii]|uniref:Uncharacterized protein n=1 Tax=Paragonimus skrjabini miyazakii TaxID=59628 RepID=A0A8S9Z5Y8_9TREM|nr:hypothetical protein EG68_00398 [Paragonimus skrjabini miyazakii]